MKSCVLAATAVASCALAACSPDGSPRMGPAASTDPVKATEALRPARTERIHVTGTVHHLDAEGGVYVIRTVEGIQYRPSELADEFRVEGLAVEAEALLHDDVMTKDQAGQTIDIVEIRKKSG